MIKFSIVTPTYKRLDKIKDFYKHLKNQKGNFEIEWVIVYEENDKQTYDFISDISDINTVLVKNNGDFSNALKIGGENATGNFINFLGDDDIIIDKSLQKICDHLSKNKEVQWVIGQGIYINEKGMQIRKIITFCKNFLLYFFSKHSLIFLNYVMSPSSFCKKNLLKKINFFENYHWYGNDYITWIRLSKITKPLILNFPITKATYSNNTLSGSFNLKGYIMMMKAIRKETSNPIIIILQLLVGLLIISYNFLNKVILNKFKA